MRRTILHCRYVLGDVRDYDRLARPSPGMTW
jgi:hypothetical protein